MSLVRHLEGYVNNTSGGWIRLGTMNKYRKNSPIISIFYATGHSIKHGITFK